MPKHPSLQGPSFDPSVTSIRFGKEASRSMREGHLAIVRKATGETPRSRLNRRIGTVLRGAVLIGFGIIVGATVGTLLEWATRLTGGG